MIFRQFIKVTALPGTLFLLLPLATWSQNAPQVVINEIMSSNNSTLADEDGDYEDWIELFNSGSEPVNLSGWALSDDENNLYKWVFPDIEIQPMDFLIVWASGKNRRSPDQPLHTGFSLRSQGEELILSSYNGIIDQLDPVSVPTDYSFGRYPDGSDDWKLFSHPTPGAPNTESPYAGITPEPQFSHAPGFYSEDFLLDLIPSHPGDVIYYTLDGSEPDTRSPVFNSPLAINLREHEKNNLSMIRTAPSNIWDPPLSEVFKGHVIRAVSVRDGYRKSEVVTGSFFVHPEGRERYTFPVVSIVTDSVHLFSNETGIMVPGDSFDPDIIYSGNYFERGRDWERPVHITLFDQAGAMQSDPAFSSKAGSTVSSSEQPAFNGFTRNAGMRIHGGTTRRYPPKSLRIYFRNEYDWDPDLNYPLFPGNTKPGNNEPLHTYKRFILRSSGNDWYHTMFKDAMVQSLYSELSIDRQEYRPAIVFINGEYWGIYNIRERYDGWYVETNYGIHRDDVVILDGNAALSNGVPADRQHYLAMRNYVKNQDMSVEEHLQYIDTQMDIDNFLEYMALQVYAANSDWPHNNIQYWRKRTQGYVPDAPYGADGRWRWMIFDLDATFAFPYRDETAWMSQYDHDMIEWITGLGNPRVEQAWVNELFNGLIENESVRNRFIVKLANYLNTRFSANFVSHRINEFKKIYEPEMQEHLIRHPGSSGNSIQGWNHHVNNMLEFASKRPDHVRKHIMDHFDISETVSLSIGLSDGNAGFVRINDAAIHSDTPGVPTDFTNWKGTYFKHIPVTLTAIPADGYQFLHWLDPDENPIERHKSNPDNVNHPENAAFQWYPEEDLHILAVFAKQDDSGNGDNNNIPAYTYLGQNYPNPFNNQTVIPYSLPERSHVGMEIYTTDGRRIKTFIIGEKEAGNHIFQADLTGLASGLYLYRMLISQNTGKNIIEISRKMTLVR